MSVAAISAKSDSKILKLVAIMSSTSFILITMSYQFQFLFILSMKRGENYQYEEEKFQLGKYWINPGINV